ncbi:alpha/beta fold hydrolase [Pseudonocardia parietis]|uniref:Pimeloyl-ACP methyl ester carboxylesterase n=1 Tax=Pseudonocardia parietis TaxID=570936 RepID=A0ABS4VQP5_9PSEU|nr:alpha/beta hydrolase [Pseudonocardia parietis]MBP2366242.1 pimeloyl-ACP methyl ester carboxylesterase [Pseudonocardia parietis]
MTAPSTSPAPVDAAPRSALASGAPAGGAVLEERVVDGAPTAVHTFGDPDAPPLLALHGLRGSHHGLAPLATRLGGLRVVVPDLPGFGASPPFRDRAHDVAGYARWAGALLRDLGPGTALLGHSFGSIVATALSAVTAPRALVLVNPIAEPASSAGGITGAGTRATALLHEGAARLGLAGVLRHRLLADAATASMTTTTDPALRRWIAAEHREHFGTFAGIGSLMEAFRAAGAGSARPWAPLVTAPVLLLAGGRDRVAPAAGQHALAAAFPDARLVVLPRTGHLVHYEAPAWAAREIAGFLGR